MTETNIKDCERIASGHRCNEQFRQLMEESAELIVAMNKAMRGNGIAAVIEEMADVLIMIEQVKYLFGISEGELQAEINRKIFRELSRLMEED